MAFSLRWLPKAQADLSQALTYIRADNPRAAALIGSSIIERVELLRDFPEMGRAVPGLNNRAIREIIHRNYRIVYRVSATELKIDIVRVWHAARGTPEL